MTTKISRQKITSFQGLRAIAFLCIFLSHMNIDYFSGTGKFGVSIFLILSGFLMITNYYDKHRINSISIKDNLIFSINKIKKLYLLHIIMMLTAIPLMIHSYLSTSANHIIIRSIVKIVINIFLVQSWFPSEDLYYSLNGVAWYLSVCVFIYFMFPYILRIMENHYTKKKAHLAITIVFILHIIIGITSSVVPMPGSIIWNFPIWTTYILPVTRLGDFIIGCNMGYLFITRNKDTEIKPIYVAFLEVISVFLAIGTCALYYYVSSINNVPAANWWIYTLLFMIPSMLLIFLSSNNNNTISKLLSNNILVHIGNISSSLFLIHQMVYKYFVIMMKFLLKDIHLSTWCYVIAVLIISILLAEIWNIFYKQINKYIYALFTQ